MILVSSCLLGKKCKYNGGDNLSPALLEYLQDKEYVCCCPEQLGGLPTPRIPAEIQGGSGEKVWQNRAVVINKAGQDVSAAFRQGAEAALDICRGHGVDCAILKEGSPSCGVAHIYDGSFSGQKIPGCGVTAALLAAAGIRLISSDTFKPDKPASDRLSEK